MLQSMRQTHIIGGTERRSKLNGPTAGKYTPVVVVISKGLVLDVLTWYSAGAVKPCRHNTDRNVAVLAKITPGVVVEQGGGLKELEQVVNRMEYTFGLESIGASPRRPYQLTNRTSGFLQHA